MAFTQADIDALDRAIKSGALRVEYADKVVWYRSLDEILRLRAMMTADVDQTNGVAETPRYSFAGYRPG